jgi:hypothetical protein
MRASKYARATFGTAERPRPCSKAQPCSTSQDTMRFGCTVSQSWLELGAVEEDVCHLVLCSERLGLLGGSGRGGCKGCADDLFYFVEVGLSDR